MSREIILLIVALILIYYIKDIFTVLIVLSVVSSLLTYAI